MNNGKLFLALIAGAAAGAALGVLFAQESGAETRKKVSNTVDDLTETLTRKGKEVIKDIKDTLAA